ncbi:MAG: IS1380 family transposase [Chloroflexi bacterium]|nr:IS1380 family transposase [Chloroflexota bacterium]
MTAWAGICPLIMLERKCGLVELGDRVLPEKESSRGLRSGQMLECFALLSAMGGECYEDMEILRGDAGLAAVLGYTPPASETARQWLDKFHDESLMAGRPLQGSFLPPESKHLAGLEELNRRVIWSYIQTVMPPSWQIPESQWKACGVGEPGKDGKPIPWVTLDIDAHLVETHKEGARPCYDGYTAFQPMVVTWAETGLILADEFREGNVPASVGTLKLVNKAHAVLPLGSWRIRIRSDSAAYEQDNLDEWNQKHWEFAVSADMTPQLKGDIEALPPDAWQPWREKIKKETEVIREWAEVAYVPSKKTEKKDSKPNRYVAIRIRSRQRELFSDGSSVRYFAVVSNRWDIEGQELLEWHRGKAGTVEQSHDILKNELGAGVYPSGKHGTNAAWLRIQVITHNLLQLLKKVALPEEYATAKPKRLRFAIFTQFGQVVRHAGRVLLRIANEAWKKLIGPGQQKIGGMVLDTC